MTRLVFAAIKVPLNNYILFLNSFEMISRHFSKGGWGALNLERVQKWTKMGSHFMSVLG